MSLAARFILASLVNTQNLMRIRCELKKIWDLGNYGIEIYAMEQALLNISKFSVPYFHVSATDVSETSFILTVCSSVLCKAVSLRLQRLIKENFSTINRCIEVVFCLYARHENLLYYVTSVKRTIFRIFKIHGGHADSWIL